MVARCDLLLQSKIHLQFPPSGRKRSSRWNHVKASGLEPELELLQGIYFSKWLIGFKSLLIYLMRTYVQYCWVNEYKCIDLSQFVRLLFYESSYILKLKLKRWEAAWKHKDKPALAVSSIYWNHHWEPKLSCNSKWLLRLDACRQAQKMSGFA